MYKLVDGGKTDEKFQRIVYGIVNRAMRGQWKQYRREIEIVYDWFKQNHDYRRDPANVELLQDVWATMDRKRFDCDDAVIWLGAAIEILGAPIRFVTISTRADREMSHVYLEAFVDGRWTPVDAIIPWATVGWEPTEGVTAKKIWTRSDVGLSGYEERPMEGLGMHDSNPENWTDDSYNVNGHKKFEEGFASGFFAVNPTGIPNDVSHTFAAGQPGSEIEMLRLQVSKEVNSTANPHQTERAGGGTYSPERPIENNPHPQDIYPVIPMQDVPLSMDRDLWTGRVPDAVLDPYAILPEKFVPEQQYLTDLAGLGGIDVSKLTPEERKRICEEYKQCLIECCRRVDEAARRILEKRGGTMSGLNGMGTYLGQSAQDIAQSVISSASSSGGAMPSGQAAFDIAQSVISVTHESGQPTTPGLLDTLIATGLSTWQAMQRQKELAAQAEIERQRTAQAQAMAAAGYRPPGPAIGEGLPSWLLPVGIGVALLAGGGAMLFGGKSKRGYRRNPKRSFPTMPLILAAGAAWFISKKNGASQAAGPAGQAAPAAA
jgi:hypothetical protein